MQRLRIRISRGEELKYISHLDIMRLWERALHRASIPLAYSEGYNPRPRISLAAPLPVGVTSEAELMDIWLSKWVSPHLFIDVVNRQLPVGVAILDVYSLALNIPSLQSLVRYAEYKVTVALPGLSKDIASAISSLLAIDSLPWHHQRDTGRRDYDLRVLIDDLWIINQDDDRCVIGMRLRCGSNGSGRAEQVMAALGYTGSPHSIHRTRLILGN